MLKYRNESSKILSVLCELRSFCFTDEDYRLEMFSNTSKVTYLGRESAGI